MQSLSKVNLTKPRLADQVYNEILSALQNGGVELDERLHQERIAEQLDVSRTPVREALIRLEREGIILPAKNGGFALRKISSADVVSNYEARVAIEGFAAGFLAESKDLEFIDELRNKVIELEKQTPRSTEEFYKVNRAIHSTFVTAANNANLTRMFDELWNRSSSQQMFSVMQRVHLDQTLVGHAELCDAIAEGSFHHAYDLTRLHIMNGLELQMAALDKLQPR